MTELGHGSTEVGHGSTELGHGSTELGHGSTEVGHGSTELGHGSTELGHGSTKVGHGTTEVGHGTTEVGHGSTSHDFVVSPGKMTSMEDKRLCQEVRQQASMAEASSARVNGFRSTAATPGGGLAGGGEDQVRGRQLVEEHVAMAHARLEDHGGVSVRAGVPERFVAIGGLLGMRERVFLIAGTFSIESGAGKGTTVYVRVPLAAPA